MTAQNIADKVRLAAERGRALRIRGGGTKDFYGQQLHGELLDVRPLSGVLSYEPSELVVTVGAGTRVHEVEALLAESGQFLPFEPPRFGVAGTVGGMVASGLSGPSRASVGALRDYVLGIQLINGRGELLTFGGQVMKNVAGYDISRLMAGSMGTLGIITQVSLKVLPIPAAEATLMFELSETSARQQLNRWRGQPLPLDASCWHDGQLWLRLRGAQAAVAAACRLLGGQLLGSDRAARQWNALRDQTLPFFRLMQGEALWRVSVPDTAPPASFYGTIHLQRPPTPDDLDLAEPASGRARVIGVQRGTLRTTSRIVDMADPTEDIARIAVLERHRATGRIGLGFVSGFGLRRGAIASTVAHDAHNVMVVGGRGADGPHDMAVAVARLAELGGGQVVVADGRVIAEIALPLGGLMSDRPLVDVAAGLEGVVAAAAGIGITLPAPFMALSFLGLSVIPDLRITDHGLIDVNLFTTAEVAVP